MVTEIEPLVVLTARGAEKITSHPKFWTQVGNIYKFKEELTDDEVREIVNTFDLMDVRRNVPEEKVPPKDREHVLKDRWIKEGKWIPGKGFKDEKSKDLCIRELEKEKKKWTKSS